MQNCKIYLLYILSSKLRFIFFKLNDIIFSSQAKVIVTKNTSTFFTSHILPLYWQIPNDKHTYYKYQM